MRVVICGAAGNMGREVVRAVNAEEDIQLVGTVDTYEVGTDIGTLCALGELGVKVNSDLEKTLKESQAEVMIDFTSPFVVMNNIEIALSCGADLVVGTTGITSVDLQNIKKAAAEKGIKAIIAPNFALGAVLMMKFSSMAAKYFKDVEVIELHHDNKIDAPSGTALKTVQMIAEERGFQAPEKLDEIEKVPNVRGGELEGINMHSVRLPGLVAHQQVIFGGLGQTLTIKHDSINRTSFMPGVIMALRKLEEIEGVVYGLENIIT